MSLIPHVGRPAVALAVFGCLAACTSSGLPVDPSVSFTSAPIKVPGVVQLKPPVLSFNDTGLSVSDGITRNGLWSVDSADFGWEFSLDLGATWTRGTDKAFEVKDNGAQTLWVRARDDAGNTSEIVRAHCVLDTLPPSAVWVSPERLGVTNALKLLGMEPDARWEYAVEPQGAWMPGQGTALGVFGNGLATVWLRQVDVAGNASTPHPFALNTAQMAVIEASDDPVQPHVLAQGLQTLLIHGTVARGDADHVRWDIPKGQQLLSVRWLHPASENASAIFALQANRVFDAGVDVSRMLVQGPMGASDGGRNVLAHLPASQLSEGPMTLRVQHHDALPTHYVFEVVFKPAD